MIPFAALFDVGMKVLEKVIPDPEARAKAQAELLRVQQEGRLAELQADNIEAQEVTKRQQADMSSDSWLSKNIRPMTLVFILAAYFTLALVAGPLALRTTPDIRAQKLLRRAASRFVLGLGAGALRLLPVARLYLALPLAVKPAPLLTGNFSPRPMAKDTPFLGISASPFLINN